MSVRKMVIVPYQILEDMKRQKQRPRLPPNPQVADVVHLQNKMSGILETSDMSETEKVQKYGETLFKLQNSLKKAQSWSQPSQQHTTTPSNPEPNSMHDRILQSVPKTMQRKAELLLNMVKDNENLVWDNHGVVSYKGKRLPGSNIIDLINDSLRLRKGIEPRGWETFSKALHESNVPQEVIGNQARWKWMHKQNIHDDKADESESDDYSTPTKSPPSAKMKKQVHFADDYSTPKKLPPSAKIKKQVRTMTPYTQPGERDRLREFYRKELTTPIKQEASTSKRQTWERY